MRVIVGGEGNAEQIIFAAIAADPKITIAVLRKMRGASQEGWPNWPAGITIVVTSVEAKGKTGVKAWLSSDDSSALRHGDGVADATEGAVAAVAATGGDDEAVFAVGDWIAKDDFAVNLFP